MASVGIIEISNITKGYLVCDTILKLTSIKMLSAGSVCPGKFVMVFTGTISSVSHACQHIQESFSEYILDISEFGNIDDRIFDAINGVIDGRLTGAVGIIETYSAASCILAADHALKAANVDIAELRLARGMGGKSFVSLTGTISSVNEAVEVGKSFASENGFLNDTTIIASPHEDLWQYII